MKLFGYRAVAAIAIVALVARPASAQVVNGGFETGNFSGWSHTGNTLDDFVVGSGWPHTGNFAGIFGPIGSFSFLSQTVGTTTGQGYTLSFWMGNGAGTPSFFDVSWDGTSLFSLTNPAVSDYVHYTFNVFGGAGSDTELKFTFRHDPDFFALDDVSLTANEFNQNGVVPEPATMSLLATGLAGMAGAGMRRRRKQA